MELLDYKKAFFAALALHGFIAVILFIQNTSTRPVLTAAKSTTSSSQPMMVEQEQPQAIKAVSVNSQEVMETVNRLKEERLQQRRAEESRQKRLTQQAEAARNQRILAQKQVQQLKDEAAKLAVARDKQRVEEQRHLKQLAQEKALQETKLAEMKKKQLALKKQQEQETLKLAALEKKKAVELARLEQANAAKVSEALAQKQQAAAQQAALNAQKNTQMAGEVDKYKAMIIDAISQRWILPENVNSHLSSQFRIRLAPNGVVLDVSLTRSSGDAILDRSAQSAIFKASPLPVPSDPEAFNIFRDISLTVRPENARG